MGNQENIVVLTRATVNDTRWSFNNGEVNVTKKILITLDRLRELLSFDETTGVFVWRTKRPGKGKQGERAGRINPNGYRCIRIDGQDYYAQHLSYFLKTGEFPTLGRIGSKDGNPDNCAWDNLTFKAYRHGPRAEVGEKRNWHLLTRAEKSGYYRASSLRKAFGITIDQFNAMLLAQNGVCKICGRPETVTWQGEARQLSVDRCHKTGRIRGLLCTNCNNGLGRFEDNPVWLRKAAEHVEAEPDAALPTNVIPMKGTA